MTRLTPCRTRCACRMMRATRGRSKTAAKILLPFFRTPRLPNAGRAQKKWQQKKPCATTVSGFCCRFCPKISKLFKRYFDIANKKWKQQNRCGTRAVANVAKFLRKMNFEISLIRAYRAVRGGRKPHCVSALLPNLEQHFQFGNKNGNGETRIRARFFYICFQKVHILYVL